MQLTEEDGRAQEIDKAPLEVPSEQPLTAHVGLPLLWPAELS